jgi:sterol desaturase/sphingolipid hydroxylase (fatty acid hydroxylase superfamily)
MDNAFFAWLAESYEWKLSLLGGLGIVLVSLAGRMLRAIPAFGESHRLNATTLARKMERASYAENQQWNRKWGAIFVVIAFGLIVPFALTSAMPVWWQMLINVVVILFVYDFFYYLMHRFLFHDGPLGGPLMWVHAVHHRQHNPCRADSSYIHPFEVAMGLGLFVFTVLGLSLIMGRFDLVTFVAAWVAFSSINLHNHTLWESNRFPFRYMKYASEMHHNHHARFTGGNFATITLLFDWMFGTLDHGKGYRNEVRRQYARGAAPVEPAE